MGNLVIISVISGYPANLICTLYSACIIRNIDRRIAISAADTANIVTGACYTAAVRNIGNCAFIIKPDDSPNKTGALRVTAADIAFITGFRYFTAVFVLPDNAAYYLLRASYLPFISNIFYCPTVISANYSGYIGAACDISSIIGA